MKKYKYRKRFTYEGKTYSVYADKKVDLGRLMERKLEELKHSPKILNEYTTVSEWAYKCIESYKTNQSPKTHKDFIYTVRANILSMIGDRLISSIRPIDCQNVLNAQAGRSVSQINAVCQALAFLFSHALENNLIVSDPTVHLVRPSGTRGHRRALTTREREIVIKVAKTDRRYYLYLLMIFCGCRPSEAAEVRGRDITKIDGFYMLHIRGTKTALSDRYVPIPDELYQLIRKTPKFETVALNERGNKITNQARLWNSFSRQLNLEMGCRTYRNKLIPPYPLAQDLVPYCLRHEYCTNLARQGVDVRTAQKLMGHTTIKTTVNIYTHVDNSALVKAAKVLQAAK